MTSESRHSESQPGESRPGESQPGTSRGMTQICMFGDGSVREELSAHHYLGMSTRCIAWYRDEYGIAGYAMPTSRRLPFDGTWIELARWCILSGKNAGSMQWSRMVPWLRDRFQNATTVVSYSDPSVGHDGALYRACNWLWAPTWHVLRPPPTGAGLRSGKIHSPKHRWVFPLRYDINRTTTLAVRDESIMRAHPEWCYVEPKWNSSKSRFCGGGGDFRSWRNSQTKKAEPTP